MTQNFLNKFECTSISSFFLYIVRANINKRFAEATIIEVSGSLLDSDKFLSVESLKLSS